MRIWQYILITIFVLIFLLFLIRIILPSQIDDVSPGIPCEKNLMKKVDVLYVIPKFKGIPISENKTWCDYILSLNKKLEMHGITHKYNEFDSKISPKDLDEGMEIFKKCFGYEPERFKPPQLAISAENKKMVNWIYTGIRYSTKFIIVRIPGNSRIGL